MDSLETRLKHHAHALGFDLAGIAPATPADGFDRLRAWLDQGYAGEMTYMRRHADARRDPASILPEVRSVVMLGMNYRPAEPPRPAAPTARVARYARGLDYHDVLRQRLNRLLDWVQGEAPGCAGRGVVLTPSGTGKVTLVALGLPVEVSWANVVRDSRPVPAAIQSTARLLRCAVNGPVVLE